MAQIQIGTYHLELVLELKLKFVRVNSIKLKKMTDFVEQPNLLLLILLCTTCAAKAIQLDASGPLHFKI